MLLVVALLISNMVVRSGWILLTSIAMMIMAIIVYFIPRKRK